MKININGKEITLKNSFRTLMLYENIANESFQLDGTISNMLLYFYCNVLASSDCEGIMFDDFVDWLDEHPEDLQEYMKWLNEQNKMQSLIQPKSDKTGEKKTNKRKVKN